MIPVDNKECSICLEEMISDLQVLTCKHEFHKNCVQRWCLENNICPICRTQVDIPKSNAIIFREVSLKFYYIILHTVYGGTVILNVLYSNVYEEFSIVIFWVFANILVYNHKEALSYMAYIALASVIVYTSHRLMENKRIQNYEVRLLSTVSVQSICMLLIDAFRSQNPIAFS